MTKEEAIRKIEASISDGAQLITPKGKTYEEHLKDVTEVLFEHLIEPIEAKVTSACFPEYDFDKYKNSKVWAIANMGNSWLLTLENENEFALGFGDSADYIMMHGFSSSDAVGEWCA
jgi:6-phosphogluconate dehydrogenase (decarboxylating)